MSRGRTHQYKLSVDYTTLWVARTFSSQRSRMLPSLPATTAKYLGPNGGGILRAETRDQGGIRMIYYLVVVVHGSEPFGFSCHAKTRQSHVDVGAGALPRQTRRHRHFHPYASMPKASKIKYYAVRIGREGPKIYKSWDEVRLYPLDQLLTSQAKICHSQCNSSVSSVRSEQDDAY